MTEPFIGEIQIYGFNFAPRGWAFCNGQTLGIAQNTALFSLLGTTYGGNGQTTFALPNLQAQAICHSGPGPGLTERIPGEALGSDTVTLLQTEIPQHSHGINAFSQPDPALRTGTPVNNGGLAFPGSSTAKSFIASPANAQLSPSMLATTGSSVPHENRQPYLGLNFCIALQGIFPSRN